MEKTQQQQPKPAEKKERTNNNQQRRPRKKVCYFCAEKTDHIDYKDVNKLKKFITERAKIMPRRMTGTCAQHQRKLTAAIKKSRQIALLPFISE